MRDLYTGGTFFTIVAFRCSDLVLINFDDLMMILNNWHYNGNCPLMMNLSY